MLIGISPVLEPRNIWMWSADESDLCYAPAGKN